MFRVAIVGRPNVGKSSLFNKMTRTRKAIVGDQPGITRDRIFQVAQWDDRYFEVVDTGGIIPEDKEDIPEAIFRQAEIAVEEASLILLVVDGREGITPIDSELTNLLRSEGREFFLVVNKIDDPVVEPHVPQFHALGVEKIFPVSAEHSRGINDLLGEIASRVPESDPDQSQDEIRVAIIGRPNMGKSSLLNKLIGEERVIVTDIAGTTRDSVDTVLDYKGSRYRLVDTAGIRRKGKTTEVADKLSVVMARKSIERCDVVLLLLDPFEGATKPDATIGGYAHDAGKSVIVAVNKWDLVERDTYTSLNLEKEFRQKMRFLEYAPFVFISAKTGQRAFKLLDLATQAHRARYKRIATAELNRFMEAKLRNLIQSDGSSRKTPVLYGSQVGVAPPTFVLFTRTRRQIHFSKQRFIINQLRDEFGFFATPIRLIQRIREKK
jgi:GTP-binding protein